MKQNMKRLLVVLCMMAACLLSLTACSAETGNAAASSEDDATAAYVGQLTAGLLEDISSYTEEQVRIDEAEMRKQNEPVQTVLADGLVSWAGVMNDTGALVSVISSVGEVTEDGYAGIVMAQFENRKCEFKILYDVDGQNLVPTSITFSPEYTVGEKMAKAAMNTLMGMGTVFIVLIFISLLIGCFKYINVFEKKMRAKAEVPVPAPAAAVEVLPAAEEEELADDLELVAVITAAIAAASDTPADGLVVRSIKRASGAKWKRA